DAWPRRVGSIDGLPATTRDAANRLWLRRRLNDLAATRPAAPGHPPGFSGPVLAPAGTAEQRAAQSLLDRLEAQDADPTRTVQPLFLLAVDTRGDGRAVVSIGDPDRAKHVAVSIPGTTTDLAAVPGQVNRWNNMQQEAMDNPGLTPSDVAVVVWFDYDAPDDYAQATADGMAEHAAADLARFVDGVRASHVGDPPHVTVLGHSYGSVVVGEAARLSDDTGAPRRFADVLKADDIVVTGSPGMHVPNADHLNITDGHLWVGLADADWMRYGGDPFEGDGPDIHGTDPHTPRFAGDRVHPIMFEVAPGWDAFWSDPTAPHSSYWDGAGDEPSPGAANQANIIIGRHENVTAAPPSALTPPGVVE
ncbi:MAG: hypothetical protein H7Y15_18970, partial [Pseudonocardia sp.]|nr:hypothetical protein [Pseudonocardia sp.]